MPDYMYMLESRCRPATRGDARVRKSAETGLNVYLTGGAVRDLISGMPIFDLDFTVEGNPARLAQELEKSGAQIVSQEEKQRHIEMLFAGDVDGSLAAARDDVYAGPERGRKYAGLPSWKTCTGVTSRSMRLPSP